MPAHAPSKIRNALGIIVRNFLFTSLICLCTTANALTWHAIHDAGAGPDVDYTSPASICQSIAKHAYLLDTYHIAIYGEHLWNLPAYQCTINTHYTARFFIVPDGPCPPETSYDPATYSCVTDKNSGDKGPPPPEQCGPTGYVGNPINIAKGNKYQEEIDFAEPALSTLSFKRSYNSIDGLWRHNHSTHLIIESSTVKVVMHHGREALFNLQGDTISAPPTELGVLEKQSDGWTYLASDNQKFEFDANGRLLLWSNGSGTTHQLTYSGETVTITDQLGHNLSFTEDPNHQPLTLSTNSFDVAYSYNDNKRLISMTKTQGGATTQRLFHYEDARNNAWLTGITDERGVRYATWRYDEIGRAIYSEHADGADRVQITYHNDGTRTVTNALGKETVYNFSFINGVARITSIRGEPSANCPNSESRFFYDNRGLLTRKYDNKFTQTNYHYNSRGLETTRVEAYGNSLARVTTTEWHPTLFLPMVVTEPTRITRYQYDNQGRQLSRTVEER